MLRPPKTAWKRAGKQGTVGIDDETRLPRPLDIGWAAGRDAQSPALPRRPSLAGKCFGFLASGWLVAPPHTWMLCRTSQGAWRPAQVLVCRLRRRSSASPSLQPPASNSPTAVNRSNLQLNFPRLSDSSTVDPRSHSQSHRISANGSLSSTARSRAPTRQPLLGFALLRHRFAVSRSQTLSPWVAQGCHKAPRQPCSSRRRSRPRVLSITR